jgi:type IV secretion system protein VirB10
MMGAPGAGTGPGGLGPPRPSGAKAKKVVYIVTAVLAVLALTIMVSLTGSGKEEKSADQGKKTEETRSLMPGNEERGLAGQNGNSFPEPPKNETGITPPPEAKELTPPPNENRNIVVGPPVRDLEEEERKRQAVDDLRRKREARYAALGSQILSRRVNIPEKASQGQGQNQPSGLKVSDGPTVSPYPDGYDPAADRDKENFLQRNEVRDWLNPYTREASHPFEIKTGTVIPGLMVTAINSDLPGNLIAQVSQNVFDTATGKYLLIPQGAKLFGAYDSRIVYGQERILFAWNRIVFPDGSSLSLGAMPGADMSGVSGVSDTVDHHYLRLFGSAVLMSLVTGGMSYAMDSGNDSGNEETTTVKSEMSSALAAQIGQTTMKMLEKNLNIKPTLGVRAGFRFNVIATKDIVFREPYAPLDSILKKPGDEEAFGPVAVK